MNRSIAGELPQEADFEASAQAASPATGAQETPNPNQLKQKAMRGGLWTVGAYGAAQGVRFLSQLILARVLMPDHFGLMGLVTVVMIGLQMFSDIGIGPAIIQNKRQDPAFVNTAWTMQVVRGFLLWGAAAVAAVPLAYSLDARLVPLLPLVAVTAAISGFQSTNWFTANRNLAIKWIMLIELAAIIGQAVTMIVYAYGIEVSYWALAAGVPVYALIRTVCSHFLPGVRNRIHWDRTAAHDLFHFGKWLFISTVITFAALHADKLLLRTFTDSVTFGLFWIAVQLAELGPILGAKLGSMVGFPALSEVYRTRPDDLKRELHRVRRALVLPMHGILLLMILLAPALFYVLYKPSFWNAGWIVQALAINSLAGQLNTSYAHIYMATGRTFYNMITVFAQMVLVVSCTMLGYYAAGDTGFILGLTASQFFKYPVDSVLCARLGVQQWHWDLRVLISSSLLALLMVGLSLLITPYAMELGIEVQEVLVQLKSWVKGGAV